MIRITPYENGDILKIDPVPGAFDAYAQEDLSRMVEENKNPSISVFTVKEDGEILAVICWYFLWDGVVELLAITDKKIKKKAIPFAKVMKEWMDHEVKFNNMRRVQTTLRATYPEGSKWLSFLGMEQEGVMRKFCPDKVDCQIWARVD